ncbi:hypothetical protein L3X38_027350 [Prunus dulcis]|uniref:Ubiquitin-like protease family profile domain-containing protein n=1 Tax=Prunus dulcis TaxID=3755 RepID=A0AAD4Z0C2_PRUDU|nr:hypothetical protein L3X38_027350 [Prunus dulcis]
MVSQHQSKDSGSKKNGGKELGMVAPQEKSSKKMKFASSSAETEPTSQTTISDDSKSGRGIGQAHSEMQSYIGVLARSRVPLLDMKWSQIPKDLKEQIWEAVDMAFVVGQGGKNSVLASAAKKWKDFKSTLTRHYILPYINDTEKLSQPPETYKFIEKAQWDAFVASRLSKDFESVHSQHAQIREKLEYNHRLSRKGYAGLEDELEETMLGVEIDRSTLWKRARQDKHGNIPDPKVAEKAKLIDELQKQVSEGKVGVYGSNDVLTMALGPEHPGRVIEVGDYSNMETPSSLKTLCRYVETTLVPEDKTLQFTIDKEVFGRERDAFLLPEDFTQFACMEEIRATVVAVYMRYLHDVLKQANMCSMVGFIDPATVSANSGTIAERSRLVAARLQKTDGEQIFMMPYNPGRHWVLLIVRAKRETVYFLDPLPGNRVVDEEAKNIVNSAIKIYNSHIARAGRKSVIWKTLLGTPKQPSNVECGYYVMRFMRDIIMDPSLAFEKRYAKGSQEAPYPKVV